jgi:predicted Holliday junction resolvase-like endonuclease
MSEIVYVCGILFCAGVAFWYRKRYITMLSQKKSSEVRLGQIAEHLTPFLKDFKHDPKRARFIGMPIDYIIFEDDKIIFFEIKTGYARLSKTQQNLKRLVQEGKIVWEEFRLEPHG